MKSRRSLFLYLLLALALVIDRVEALNLSPGARSFLREMRALRKTDFEGHEFVRARLAALAGQENVRLRLYRNIGRIYRGAFQNFHGDTIAYVFGEKFCHACKIYDWNYGSPGDAWRYVSSYPPEQYRRLAKIHIAAATFEDTLVVGRFAGERMRNSEFLFPKVYGDWQAKVQDSYFMKRIGGRPDLITIYHTNEDVLKSLKASVNNFAESMGIQARRYLLDSKEMSSKVAHWSRVSGARSRGVLLEPLAEQLYREQGGLVRSSANFDEYLLKLVSDPSMRGLPP